MWEKQRRAIGGYAIGVVHTNLKPGPVLVYQQKNPAAELVHLGTSSALYLCHIIVQQIYSISNHNKTKKTILIAIIYALILFIYFNLRIDIACTSFMAMILPSSSKTLPLL